MKREKMFTCVWSAFLGGLLSIGSIFCFGQAFSVISEGMLLPTAILFCIFGAVYSACYVFFPGWTAPCAFGVLTVGMLFWGDLADSLIYVARTMSATYGSIYGWTILPVAGQVNHVSPMPALWFFGSIVALLTARSACRNRSVGTVIAGSAAFFIAGLVDWTAAPSPLWVSFLLIGWMILLLTSYARRKNRRQGNLLVVMVILPAVIVMNLLFAAVPQEGYDKKIYADRIAEQIRNWINEQGFAGTGHNDADIEDLTQAHIFDNSSVVALRVTASESKRLYLRGTVFDTYEGTRWIDSGQVCGYSWPHVTMTTRGGEVQIKTISSEKVKFHPYYIVQMSGDFVMQKNPSGSKAYTYVYSTLDDDFQKYASKKLPSVLSGPTVELPEQTREWAEPLAEQMIRGGGSLYDQAQRIISYVSDLARYDLRTERLPQGKTDFAQWFLYESDTGYCVHFATAAAVLLRAAGFPARYVTGYAVQTRSAETVTVYEKDAHAWVEVYIAGIGWLPMDPTPYEEITEDPVIEPTDDSTGETPDSSTEETGEDPTHETDETPSTQAPEDPDEQMPSSKDDGFENMQAEVVFLLSVLLAAGVLWAQYRIRRKIRYNRLRRGRSNRQTIARWQYSAYLARLLHEDPPEVLFVLAQRARFSQHRIARQELQQFDRYITDAEESLRKKPVHYRMFYRFVLAVL